MAGSSQWVSIPYATQYVSVSSCPLGCTFHLMLDILNSYSINLCNADADDADDDDGGGGGGDKEL